jgi:hypothetical protein
MVRHMDMATRSARLAAGASWGSSTPRSRGQLKGERYGMVLNRVSSKKSANGLGSALLGPRLIATVNARLIAAGRCAAVAAAAVAAEAHACARPRWGSLSGRDPA